MNRRSEQVMQAASDVWCVECWGSGETRSTAKSEPAGGHVDYETFVIIDHARSAVLALGGYWHPVLFPEVRLSAKVSQCDGRRSHDHIQVIDRSNKTMGKLLRYYATTNRFNRSMLT